MNDPTCPPVSMSRRIPAPARQVFALLADPAAHPGIDGSGMLRGPIGDAGALTRVGDAFTMRMHNDEMGDYEMVNHVVEFEPDRRVGWEPVLSAASRPEDLGDIGESARQRWSFELVPDGDDATVVTETFDCSRSPEWLRRAVKGGERWRSSMAATLEALERRCVSTEAPQP